MSAAAQVAPLESSPDPAAFVSSSEPFPPPPPSNPELWPFIQTPAVGTQVRRMGYLWTQTAEHPTVESLHALRTRGDPDADELTALLRPGFGTDVVGLLAQRASRVGTADSLALPEADRALDAQCQAFLRKYSKLPDWVDRASIQRGQEVFQRNVMSSLLALLYASLIGGFGAPMINAVLLSTNYLTGCNAAPHKRLIETTLMVMSVLGPDARVMESPWVDTEGEASAAGAAAPSADSAPAAAARVTNEQPKPAHHGEGWLACMRVRFLHAKVRSMLLRRRGANTWDAARLGTPINQEDLLGTLLSFSFNVPHALRQLGVVLTAREEEDYVHVWRLVGWLTGQDADVLDKHMSSYAASQRASQAVMMHLVQPDHASAVLAHHVLMSFTRESVMGWRFNFHSAMSRTLMSPLWADTLLLPEPDRLTRLKAALLIAFMKSVAWVANRGGVWATLAGRWPFLFVQKRLVSKFRKDDARDIKLKAQMAGAGGSGDIPRVRSCPFQAAAEASSPADEVISPTSPVIAKFSQQSEGDMRFMMREENTPVHSASTSAKLRAHETEYEKAEQWLAAGAKPYTRAKQEEAIRAASDPAPIDWLDKSRLRPHPSQVTASAASGVAGKALLLCLMVLLLAVALHSSPLAALLPHSPPTFEQIAAVLHSLNDSALASVSQSTALQNLWQIITPEPQLDIAASL